MRNGALITQFPGVTWFVDCTIPGISEILVARRHHAERSIGALICPTTGGKFLSPANPLAIRMLGQFLSVEIQASVFPVPDKARHRTLDVKVTHLAGARR